MNRMDRVNQAIKKEISNMIQYGDINDPRLTFVTITSVEVSKDLQHAKVNYSVFTDNPNEQRTVHEGMMSARGLVRRLIGQRVKMRYTPEIVFIQDHSLRYSAEIDQKLEEIKNLKTEEGSSDAE